MCDVKKLCTCEEVKDKQDFWRLEFLVGSWPSWGEVAETRPEHKELAEEIAKKDQGILGPLPMPQFEELFIGLADITQMKKVVEAEAGWLNREERPFDFDYEPFEGDRLIYTINGVEIAFSYFKGKWEHYPHQAYSVDSRFGINAEKEDAKARQNARAYLKSKQKPENS